MTWLEVAIVFIIVLILIISSVMLIPFRVAANGSISIPESTLEISLYWMGIRLWRFFPLAPGKKKEGKKEEEKKRERPSFGEIRKLASTFWDSIPAFRILFRSLRKATRVSKLHGNVRFGTGDPADTALIAGYLWSFSALVRLAFPASDLVVQPNLTNELVEGSIDAEARIRAGYLASGLIRAYSKKPFRKFISEVRSLR